MTAILPAGTPSSSCADCLAWGLRGPRRCAACAMFRHVHPGQRECAGCRRVLAVKDGYCRLCWQQAEAESKAAGGLPRGPISALAAHPGGTLSCHQLFFDRMKRRQHRRVPEAPQKQPGSMPPPPAGRPAAGSVQLTLFPVRRDLTRVSPDDYGTGPGSPWLAWALHIAGRLGVSRGWTNRVRTATRQGLAVTLASFTEGDVIRHSEISPPLLERFIGIGHVAEVLAEMGIYDDDRPPALEDWLESKLGALPPAVRRDVTAWAQALRDGTARSGPRSPRTVNQYAASLLPALASWSLRHDHLREVTRDDVLAFTRPLRGQQRNDAIGALRSLFRFCARARLTFRDPTTGLATRGIRDKVVQPLAQSGVDSAVAAVATPAGRLIIALAAVHAARKNEIRGMRLGDVDQAGRRLTIAGLDRPLDDLTCQLLTAWLTERQRRWPATANPHLLINAQTAMSEGPVSSRWASQELRGQEATLERLRMDRQLGEALVSGADPLHLAAVFGIHPTTAMRYAQSARPLLETTAERQDPASVPRTQGSDPSTLDEHP
ncbi:MAG: tyrosine-type recombinase/integrase [Streptosporangiaceae bacterium]